MSAEPDAGTAKFLGDTDKFLDGVAAVIHTFATDGIRWRSATSADGLRSAAILAHPEPYMARAGLMTTAAVIRSAAQETGKSECEILAELRCSAGWPPIARLPQGHSRTPARRAIDTRNGQLWRLGGGFQTRAGRRAKIGQIIPAPVQPELGRVILTTFPMTIWGGTGPLSK
jgi:hypothetical protein